MGYEEGIAVVELHALVVMRIMKHCRQHAPHSVTGQLLGLDIGQHLLGHGEDRVEGERDLALLTVLLVLP